MGGISGSGLISGIDTASLVNQLIQVASRPRQLAQQRLVQLQTQQAAYLDINSRVNALRTAAGSFRVDRIFDAKQSTSSNTDVLSATANNQAQAGSYSLIVDRLVSSQQLLTRGFQDRDTSAFGATSFTVEPEAAKLAKDTQLSELNGGQGIERGSILINDGTTSQTIDLSKVGTVNEVLDAINGSGLNITARVSGGKFIVDGATSITSGTGSNTAESLGLDTSTGAGTVGGGAVTGSDVYTLTSQTALIALNDGNGVRLNSAISVSRFDFTIEVDPDGAGGADPESVFVNLGAVYEDQDGELVEVEPAVSTVEGAIERINAALAGANGGAGYAVTASVNATTGGLSLTSTDAALSVEVKERGASDTAARDLGIDGLTLTGAGTADGARVLAGMNTVLLKSLGGGNGGVGIPGDGSLDITLRDGTNVNFTLTTPSTVEEYITLVNQLGVANGDKFELAINDTGTGFTFTDKTSGNQNLIITGTDGADTAAALGLSTGASGVAASTFGQSAQLRYISEATRLDSLNGGDGIGTGTFRIIGSTGEARTIDIGDDAVTLRDIISEINAQAAGATARINDNGDGIIIESDGSGATAIEIEDLTGTVATRLGIAGTAENNTDQNFVNGSQERVIEFDPTDTLDDAVRKLNDAGAGIRVSILNDGSSTSPFRLSIVASSPGSDGRFILDTNGFDLGSSQINQGQDARVFFGSEDPAEAILLTSSTNTLDDVLQGVTIDLKTTSDDPVTLTIADDTETIETQVETFISAYNTVIDRIGQQTRFVEETNERGALLGDGTILGLQTALSNAINGTISGFSETFDRLTDVGITVGEGGRLEFDTERFRDALSTDPQAVEDLFTRRTIDPDAGTTVVNGVTITDRSARTEFTELGLLPQIEELARSYTDSIDGVLTLRNQAIDNQISSQNDRIESLTEALDRERFQLESQFVAMEQAIAQLQSQQSALASIGF
jgi:flagellar hook-associated protein 2